MIFLIVVVSLIEFGAKIANNSDKQVTQAIFFEKESSQKNVTLAVASIYWDYANESDVMTFICFPFLIYFLRKNEVEEDSEQEDYCYAVLSKDSLDNLWEHRKHLCCLCEAQANAERERYDDHVAL